MGEGTAEEEAIRRWRVHRRPGGPHTQGGAARRRPLLPRPGSGRGHRGHIGGAAPRPDRRAVRQRRPLVPRPDGRRRGGLGLRRRSPRARRLRRGTRRRWRRSVAPPARTAGTPVGPSPYARPAGPVRSQFRRHIRRRPRDGSRNGSGLPAGTVRHDRPTRPGYARRDRDAYGGTRRCRCGGGSPAGAPVSSPGAVVRRTSAVPGFRTQAYARAGAAARVTRAVGLPRSGVRAPGPRRCPVSGRPVSGHPCSGRRAGAPVPGARRPGVCAGLTPGAPPGQRPWEHLIESRPAGAPGRSARPKGAPCRPCPPRTARIRPAIRRHIRSRSRTRVGGLPRPRRPPRRPPPTPVSSAPTPSPGRCTATR